MPVAILGWSLPSRKHGSAGRGHGQPQGSRADPGELRCLAGGCAAARVSAWGCHGWAIAGHRVMATPVTRGCRWHLVQGGSGQGAPAVLNRCPCVTRAESVPCPHGPCVPGHVQHWLCRATAQPRLGLGSKEGRVPGAWGPLAAQLAKAVAGDDPIPLPCPHSTFLSPLGVPICPSCVNWGGN